MAEAHVWKACISEENHCDTIRSEVSHGISITSADELDEVEVSPEWSIVLYAQRIATDHLSPFCLTSTSYGRPHSTSSKGSWERIFQNSLRTSLLLIIRLVCDPPLTPPEKVQTRRDCYTYPMRSPSATGSPPILRLATHSLPILGRGTPSHSSPYLSNYLSRTFACLGRHVQPFLSETPRSSLLPVDLPCLDYASSVQPSWTMHPSLHASIRRSYLSIASVPSLMQH